MKKRVGVGKNRTNALLLSMCLHSYSYKQVECTKQLTGRAGREGTKTSATNII